METSLISGPKRSGTHLLYRLLDDHQDIFNSLAEKYYLEYVDQLNKHETSLLLRHLLEEDIDRVLDQVEERALLPLFHDDADFGKGYGPEQDMKVSIDKQRLKSNFNSARETCEETVEGVWKAWFRSLQKTINPESEIQPVLFKCADYGPSARTIADMFENRRILFIVRNPVFSFSSLRKLRSRQPSRNDFTTLRLIEEISRYRRFHEVRENLSGRADLPTHTVLFENLAKEPEKTMRGVSEFLNISYDEVLSVPTFRGESWKGNSSYGSYEAVSTEPLNPDRINLTEYERELVGEGLKDVMDEHGYELYPSPP